VYFSKNVSDKERGEVFVDVLVVCLFVFLPLQPILVVFSQPSSGL
jgi:hypothetical protein